MVSNKSISDPKDVVGKRNFIKEVAETAAKSVMIMIVDDLQNAVFHAEGITEVFPKRITADFRNPAVEVLAVEEWNPTFLRPIGFRGLSGQDRTKKSSG